jgi:hypothetical protein
MTINILGVNSMSKSRKHRYKGGTGFGAESTFSDVRVGAWVGHCFTDGRRGMAKAVRGAKKYVRSRIRAADKMKVKQVVGEL